MNDYEFCILQEFDQVYATSSKFSWTNAEQFKKFCKAADIRCDEVSPDNYFKPGMCDGAFLTREYTYDANILKEYLVNKINTYPNVTVNYGVRIKNIKQVEDSFVITLSNEDTFTTKFLLNATYASTNQITSMLGYEPFKIKYELCEIILCKVNDKLKNVGFTVMDGPFFSIMPFGKPDSIH